MKSSQSKKVIKAGLLILSSLLLAAFLVPAPAEAQDDQFDHYGYGYGYGHGTPCPNFSIQDVFDDPNTDWDRDHVSNVTELYNGLNPCIKDAKNFCASSPTLCVPVVTPGQSCSTGYWTWVAVDADPNGDWDRDGVTNRTEAINGANPCDHPCPHPSSTDVALNPNGSWDRDGVSNAVEVYQGTNPCDGYTYNPCPHWSAYQVRYMPNLDWDHDGISNAEEVRRGTNPCVRNTGHYAPAPVYTPRPLPHVDLPPAGYKCPHGFPYYHAPTNLCYRNPVGRY